MLLQQIRECLSICKMVFLMVQSSFQRDLGARKSPFQNGTEGQKLSSLTSRMHDCCFSLLTFYSLFYKEAIIWGWFRLAPPPVPSWICDKIRVIHTEWFPFSARLCCRPWLVLCLGQPPSFFRLWTCIKEYTKQEIIWFHFMSVLSWVIQWIPVRESDEAVPYIPVQHCVYGTVK